MPKNIDDLYKELSKTNKEIHQLEHKFLKDVYDVTKLIKNIDKKINQILQKIQEFEVVADSSEDDESYDEWNPYTDNYQTEEYDSYDNDSSEDTL
jgi:predicted transcriptional regulator